MELEVDFYQDTLSHQSIPAFRRYGDDCHM